MDNKDTLAVRSGNWLIDKEGDKVTVTHMLRADNDKQVMEFGIDDVNDFATVVRTLWAFLDE